MHSVLNFGTAVAGVKLNKLVALKKFKSTSILGKMLQNEAFSMPDVTARIHLYSKDQGGTPNQISLGFRCPLRFEGNDETFHDCRLFLEPNRRYSAGEVFTVAVSFLCRELVENQLKEGAKFKLWDSRFIGEGEVLRVFPPEES